MIGIVIPHFPEFSCWLGQFSYIICCMSNIKRWIKNSGSNCIYNFCLLMYTLTSEIVHNAYIQKVAYRLYNQKYDHKIVNTFFFPIQIIIHMPNIFSFYLPPGFRLNLVLLGRYQQMCESNRNIV